ncbi:MAG: hypothetical protein ACUVUP_07015 [Thermaceae bacterium]
MLNSKTAFAWAKHSVHELGDAHEGGRLQFFAALFQNLPIPYIPHPYPKDPLPEAQDLYHEGNLEGLLSWAHGKLKGGHKGEVASLLGFLALGMQDLHKERLSSEKEWQRWVEHTFKGVEKLGKDWLGEGWVRDGMARGPEGILERFKAKGIRTDPKGLAKLEENTGRALEELRPIYKALEGTDRAIDLVVAWLYGLEEREAEAL